MSGVVPAPPSDPHSLHVETLPEGSLLYRVHNINRAANGPNPGYGASTRFAFFGQPVVPVLYAAGGPEAAAFETIFHDTVLGSTVPPRHWETRALSVLRVQRELRLARFHSAGLKAHDLTARDLTDTPATTYPDTVRWAEAAHAAALDGCVYISRQFNSQRAYVFFGDTQDMVWVIHGHPDEMTFAVGDGLDWLASLANDIDVDLGLGT